MNNISIHTKKLIILQYSLFFKLKQALLQDKFFCVYVDIIHLGIYAFLLITIFLISL